MTETISVIGLGKLGAPLAACLAEKGYRVIGVDVDQDSVRKVNEGRTPVFEPGLEELIRKNRERLKATDDFGMAIGESQITFILVPTPSEKSGLFSLRYVLPACEQIGKALREKEEFHLVILTSTVTPGSTRSEVFPALESSSGKRCGSDFGLCYNPEFVALGSVIHDLFNPDFLLIGESDAYSGNILESLYKRFCDNNPSVARMNFVNAELTKLTVNTFVTTKISFANMLAHICERLPGTDVDVVTSALGLDTRIGRKYLKGAVGYGGPCFPRDNLALVSLARQLGASAFLAEATDRANRQEVFRLAELVKSKIPPGGAVGILGLAYKPNTNVVEESQGLLLAQVLAGDGIPVMCYDPAAMDSARRELHESVRFADSLQECIRRVNVLVITTPWDEFRRITPESLSGRNTQCVLVDCWRLLDAKQFEGVAQYLALGVGR